MTYAIPTHLPAYVGTMLLSLACSRRAPALRPVAACFAAWSLLDAVTGPLWLRAGVLVAWPGAALAAGAWGLKDEGPDPFEPSPSRHILDPSQGRTRLRGTSPAPQSPTPRVRLAQAIAAVYLLAGCAAALPYALGYPAPYHVALPLSRALAVTLCALAAVLRPLPRTWAARACVAPAVGLACGVVAGVWTLLPAGMGAVREAWGRLAGAETWATLGVTAGCVVAAWWEATRGRRSARRTRRTTRPWS